MGSADMSPKSDIHQVVIIGASYGGIPAAHGLLQDVFPAVSGPGKKKFKVVLIAPNDHFYWHIGAPRTIVRPEVLPLGKVLFPTADPFRQYSKEQFEFLCAHATSIDPNERKVSTSTNDNVHYDSLLIASGSTYPSSAWTATDGIDSVRAGVKELQEKVLAASSIMIGGGGALGTETAGELGEAFGGKTEVTLLSGSSQLLPRLKNKSLGNDAEAQLTKLGIKVIHGVRVSSHSKTADGKTTLKLNDGSEKTVDVYIEATGGRPNNKFVPEAWLDSDGLVRTDGNTLRVDVPNVQNVYCIGSVGSYSDGSVLDIKFAKKALLESMRLDLIGKRETSSSTASLDPNPPGWIPWLTSWIPFYGSLEDGTRKIFYKKTDRDMQLVPIGAKRGVGIAFGWKLPMFAVVMAKSKDYMVREAPKVMAGTF